MQKASDVLGQRPDIETRLELQPARFHLYGIDGWSLTMMTAVCANEPDAARKIWGLVLRVLETALQAYDDER